MSDAREFDALVAEKVMGWAHAAAKWKTDLMAPPIGHEFTHGYLLLDGVPHIDVPRYSTDIAAAWTVLLAVREQHAVTIYDRGDKQWVVTFGSTKHPVGDGCAPDMPLAICRAALLAVGVEASA